MSEKPRSHISAVRRVQVDDVLVRWVFARVRRMLKTLSHRDILPAGTAEMGHSWLKPTVFLWVGRPVLCWVGCSRL